MFSGGRRIKKYSYPAVVPAAFFHIFFSDLSICSLCLLSYFQQKEGKQKNLNSTYYFSCQFHKKKKTPHTHMQRTPNKEYFRCCIMTRQYRSEEKKNDILYCVGLCRTQQLLEQTDKSALIKKVCLHSS